jgi:hypothetical protein
VVREYRMKERFGALARIRPASGDQKRGDKNETTRFSANDGFHVCFYDNVDAGKMPERPQTVNAPFPVFFFIQMAFDPESFRR